MTHTACVYYGIFGTKFCQPINWLVMQKKFYVLYGSYPNAHGILTVVLAKLELGNKIEPLKS